jgi:2-C-methyl-D-erythritol 4-phosphate cytidylyltransferase
LERFVIVVAGGSGLRMEASVPKQFLMLGGRPMLMLTLEAFFNAIDDVHVILVLPSKHIAYWEKLCHDYVFTIPHLIADGGQSRGESVKNGLGRIEVKNGIVAVHDGVRPLAGFELIRRVYALAEEKGSAIPCVPVIDSLRQKVGESSKPLDRAGIMAVQTPQCFHLDLLRKAYDQPDYEKFTDDAQLVESMGETVYLTEGSYDNLKITTVADLQIAEALFKLKPLAR